MLVLQDHVLALIILANALHLESLPVGSPTTKLSQIRVCNTQCTLVLKPLVVPRMTIQLLHAAGLCVPAENVAGERDGVTVFTHVSCASKTGGLTYVITWI